MNHHDTAHDIDAAGAERIARKAREWEHEALPARARARALYRLMPSPAVLALAVAGVIATVSDRQWLLLVALALAVYTLIHMRAADRWGAICETADHWVGDGEMPEGMTQQCPYCRDIPFRELWRGGRR